MSLPLAPDYHYQMGRLLYDRCEYSKAYVEFEKASNLFLADKSYEKYLDSLGYVLRILAEREDFNKIQQIKESLQDWVVNAGVELNSRIHYILGICSFNRPDVDKQVAMDYFQKALKLALEKDNKVDMCFAIYGIGGVYYSLGKYEEALKEFYNLEVFLSALDIPELKLSVPYLSGIIHRNRGDYDKALEIFWHQYSLLKDNPCNIIFYMVLYGLGSTYLRQGNPLLARIYLQLGVKSINEKDLPRMARLIRETLAELGHDFDNREYDLIIDTDSNSVVERSLGRVDFKNQFILIELLQLFVKNPGKVFSKEVLARKVWNEEYDPSVHDNKIYVTIKRLRQLIEPEINKPQYVFRSKNGYYLNKAAKVLVGH